MRRLGALICVILAVGALSWAAHRYAKVDSGPAAVVDGSGQTDGGPVSASPTTPRSYAGITMPSTAPTDVQLAIRLLQSPDPEERGQAASWIGSYGAEAKPAVPYLIKMLADSSHHMMSAISTPYGPTSPDFEAMRALVQMGDVALPDLLQTLKSREKTVPYMVVQNLGNMFPVKEAGMGEVSARFTVAGILGDMKCKQAVAGLLGLLKSSDPTLRMRGALSLIEIGTPEAIDGAVSVLNDPRPWRGDDLVRELGRAKAKRALPAIIRLLDHPDSRVGGGAILALGEIGDKRAIGPLRKAAANGEWFTQVYATGVLMKLGDRSPFQRLARELGKDTSDMDEHTVEKIAEANDPSVIDAALDALYAGRNVKLAIAALGKSNDSRIFPALVGVLNQAPQADFAYAARALNGRDEDGARGIFTQLLSSTNDWKHVLVVSFLDAPKTKRTVQELLGSLKETSARARWEALDKLADVGVVGQSPDGLISVLDDQEPHNRWVTVGLLGQIKSAKSVAALTKALDDQNPGVRAKAAESLGAIGTDAAVDALVAELMDPGSYTRPHAVAALGMVKNARARKYVKAAQYDNSTTVRRQADLILNPSPYALRHPKKPTLRLGFSAPAMWVFRKWDRTSRPDKRSTQQLITALGDPDEKQRDAAINTLRGRKDKAAVEPLIRALQSDPSLQVRANAAWALRLMGDPRAVPPMLNILTTEPAPPANSQPIITAGRPTLEAVIDLLNHPDKDVRRATQEVLKRMTGQDFGDSRRGWSRWVSANVGG